MERGLTLLVAGTCAFFGVWLLVDPGALGAIGIELSTPAARTDVRATYGGFDLGVAALLFICASRKQWHRIGLIGAGCVAGGFGLGRLTGILLEGGAGPEMWWFLALEATVTVAVLLTLRRQST